MKLAREEKYQYQDTSEILWKFSYERIADEEGWFAWVKRPENKDFFCVGKIPEQEIIKRLEASPAPLNQDDLIDLELWLSHGGFKKYNPRKPRKPRIKKEIEG